MPDQEYWIRGGLEALLELAKRAYHIDFADLPPDPYPMFRGRVRVLGSQLPVNPAEPITFSLARSDEPPSLDLEVMVGLLTLLPALRRLEFVGRGQPPGAYEASNVVGRWYFKNNDGLISIQTPR